MHSNCYNSSDGNAYPALKNVLQDNWKRNVKRNMNGINAFLSLLTKLSSMFTKYSFHL